MKQINGLYKTRGKHGRVKVWGYVSKVNQKTGLCKVRWPNNPSSHRYSEVGIYEIDTWTTEGLIWKG